MLIAKDARPLAPWRAFLIASGVGFAFLIHSFTISDPFNLWRYAFSFLTPLAMVFAIEAGARLSPGERGPGVPDPEPGSRGAPGGFALPAAAAFLAWLALIVNLVETRQATARRLASSVKNIQMAWAFGTAKPNPRVRSYGELQRAIPEGARLAVLLDDPWALDYARNPIVNLDLPGLAAPAPGLPSFTTPAHWRAYFASRGIRYLAFVEPDASAFMYRRGQWLYRMYQEDELFQYMAAHLVDALDTFAALAASSTVRFHGDGMYAIDLGPDASPEPDRGPPELARMDRFIRRHSEQELGNNAWQLAHRSNVVFRGDGLGPGPVILPALSRAEPMGLCDMVSALGDPPYRWLKDRTRVRVLGTGAESVRIKLWVQLAYLHTKPVVTLSLDGQTLAEAVPDEGGMVTLEAPAPCTGWCDLYILFNSTFDWWAESETSGLARLLELDWAAPP
jgi:hypothetical protein